MRMLVEFYETCQCWDDGLPRLLPREIFYPLPMAPGAVRKGYEG